MKKLLAIIMVMSMLLCLFAGCSGETQQSSQSSEASKTETDSNSDDSSISEKNSLINTDSLYPVVNEPVTLTLAVTVGATNEDPAQMWFFDWLTEKTGVKTDYMVIQSTAWDEKKPIMLATDDLPDIFLGQTFSTTEIMKYGKAGTFVAINDYIDQYGDMIMDKINMVDGAWTGIHCPDGNIYSLPSLSIAPQLNGHVLSINKVWLDNLGLAEPETIDDLYKILIAFRDEDADGDGDPDNEVPLSGSSEEIPLRYYILQAFGFIENSDNNDDNICLTHDGEACYIPLHEKYYDYLVYMNKLWSEGLIDLDYYTQSKQNVFSKGETQSFGAVPMWGVFQFTTEHWEDWTITNIVVDKAGETPLTFNTTPYIPGRLTVTKACENPDVAVRWLNCFYTPEVCKYSFYGPEYQSEDDPDGHGSILYPNEDGSMHEEVPAWNPDEMGLWDYYAYHGPANSIFQCPLDETYFLQSIYGTDFDPFKTAVPEELHWREQYLEKIADNRTYPYPPVYLSEENTTRVDELKSALDTYVENMEAKFITGAEPLSGYDAFMERLKALGAEEYEKIYVDAYADYIANK